MSLIPNAPGPEGKPACRAPQMQGELCGAAQYVVDYCAGGSAPGEALRLRGAGAGAAAASSLSSRALSARFSSRAATAIAFTASNSSRPTMSTPPSHSRIRSRIEPSASRVMPAKVPAAPFIIFTKSSKIRCCDYMAKLLLKGDIGTRPRLRKVIGVERPDLPGQRAREAEPGEIGDEQKRRRLADPTEEERADEGEQDHRHDESESEAHLVEGEEGRRPGVIERHLHQEQSHRQPPPPRAAGVEDHRQAEPEQDVEDRPGDRKRPAGRHEAGLLEGVEPGIAIARLG